MNICCTRIIALVIIIGLLEKVLHTICLVLPKLHILVKIIYLASFKPNILLTGRNGRNHPIMLPDYPPQTCMNRNKTTFNSI